MKAWKISHAGKLNAERKEKRMGWELLRRFFAPECAEKNGARREETPEAGAAWKKTARLALPAVAETALMSLTGAIDALMVGRALGAEALAAVGLTTQPRMLLLGLFFALNVGVSAVTARRKGEGSQAAVNAVLRNAMLLSLGLSLALGGLALLFNGPLMRLAGGARAENESVLQNAEAYFRITAYALPLNAVSMCVCAAQRGIGGTRIAFFVNLAGNGVNALLNYCLIGGNWGFPRLAVMGAALASAAGTAVTCLLALGTLFIGKKRYLRLERSGFFCMDGAILRAVIQVSGSAALEQAGMRFGFFLYGRIVFSLGTVLYAANQICLQICNLTLNVGDGLGMAATALTGQSLGKKRPDAALLYGKISQRMALLISLILCAGIIWGRKFLAGAFIGASTPQAGQVAAQAAEAMIALALLQPFQTGAVALTGALRGAGDNLFVALTAALCVGAVRPALTLLAVRGLRLNLAGVWALSMAEFALRFFLLYPRFVRGKWKKNGNK